MRYSEIAVSVRRRTQQHPYGFDGKLQPPRRVAVLIGLRRLLPETAKFTREAFFVLWKRFSGQFLA
jgi:hypothetical protein